MGVDREVEVMGAMVAAFESLDGEARRRVYWWFTERFRDLRTSGDLSPFDGSDPGKSRTPVTRQERQEQVSLDQLFTTINPTAQWERALIAAYWIQQVGGHSDFDAFAVSHVLSLSGVSIGNLSRELAKLTRGRMLAEHQAPAGGRKRYFVSSDGMRWVTRRLFDPEA